MGDLTVKELAQFMEQFLSDNGLHNKFADFMSEKGYEREEYEDLAEY